MKKTGNSMHYYLFNIGDYISHTYHLSEYEDLAYRRMIDFYYLHETCLPLNVEEVAKNIKMESKIKEVEIVLKTFFLKKKEGWFQNRIEKDILKFKVKSKAASKSANIRWKNKSLKDKEKETLKGGMRTHSERICERNANQEPITNKHKTKVISDEITQIKKSPIKKINFENLCSSISTESAQEFIEHRRLLKFPLTQRGFDRNMKSASKIGLSPLLDLTADQAISMTVDAGWRGVNFEYLKSRLESVKSQSPSLVDRLTDRSWATGIVDGIEDQPLLILKQSN